MTEATPERISVLVRRMGTGLGEDREEGNRGRLRM